MAVSTTSDKLESKGTNIVSDGPSISIGTITGGQNNIGKTEIAGDQNQTNNYGGAPEPEQVFEAIAAELPAEVVEDTIEPLQQMAMQPIIQQEQPETKANWSNLLERLIPYAPQIGKGLATFGAAALASLANRNPIVAGVMALCKANAADPV